MQMCELKIHHLSHPRVRFAACESTGRNPESTVTLFQLNHNCISTAFFVKFEAWSPTPTRIGIVHSSGAFAALIIQQGQVNTLIPMTKPSGFFFVFFSEQKSTFFTTKKPSRNLHEKHRVSAQHSWESL